MAVKPTNKPQFAAAASGTDIQQPDGNHQINGWVFGERPPYEYLNWLMKNYYDWIDYCDESLDDLIADVNELDGRIGIQQRGILSGLNLSWVLGGSQWSIKIGTGYCGTVNGSHLISQNTSNYTKKITTSDGKGPEAWSAGDGGGAVPSGVSFPTAGAGLWLHVFAIYNPSTEGEDFGVDSDVYASNLCTGDWTDFRRIGAIYVREDGGAYNLRKWQQADDLFEWTECEQDYGATVAQATSTTPITLAVPTGVGNGIRAIVHMAGDNSGTAWTIVYWGGAHGSTYPGANAASIGIDNGARMEIQLIVDSSARMYAANTQGPSAILIVRTRGWIDNRGRSL
jgi:hypothetical protein